METIIQVKDVTKTFLGKDNKVEALKGINLDIHKGEIYGIIGMSGAGKSTFVRCLNFLERLLFLEKSYYTSHHRGEHWTRTKTTLT